MAVWNTFPIRPCDCPECHGDYDGGFSRCQLCGSETLDARVECSPRFVNHERVMRVTDGAHYALGPTRAVALMELRRLRAEPPSTGPYIPSNYSSDEILCEVERLSRLRVELGVKTARQKNWYVIDGTVYCAACDLAMERYSDRDGRHCPDGCPGAEATGLELEATSAREK